MTTDYFIVCHNQEIAKSILVDPILGNISSLKILFVGSNPYDGRYRDKVIVCRDLKFNIEHMPKLVAYTAWYAVVRNDLSKADNICILEYDITVTDRFKQMVEVALSGNCDALGFVNTTMRDPVFLDVIPEFKEYVFKRYKCHVIDCILKNSPTNSSFWPSTSNLAMSRNFLNGFVDWYDSIIPTISEMETLAFVHERATIIYAWIAGLKINIDSTILKHWMMKSHNNMHS